MSNATKMQYASWITKNRWKPLLDWFNQNDSKKEYWTTLFGEAQKYEFQQKWPAYMDFFQKHMDHKSGKDVPLMAYSGAQQSAWQLLEAAIPAFFIPAARLLSPEQRRDFASTVSAWLEPWLPKKGETQSIAAPFWVATSFSLLVRLDALDEWKAMESLADMQHTAMFTRFIRGEDSRWFNALQQLHISQGGTEREWRVALLSGDCVEYLQTELTDLPVARTLLDYAEKEQSNRNMSDDAVLTFIYKRHPHFRVWCEQAQSEDAQTCRAAVGLLEVHGPQCDAAQTIAMGKSLGLPLKEWAPLLDERLVPATEFVVDNRVFDSTVFSG